MFPAITKPYPGHIAVIGFVVVLQVFSSLSVKADELVAVSGRSGPWQWVNGGLNTNYQFNAISLDNQPPTVVAANNAAGIAMTPGAALTLTYVSGTWYGGSVSGAWGPTGVPQAQLAYNPDQAKDESISEWMPGHWCPQSEFPLHWMELIGVFTDAGGSIIGTPYAINGNRALVIPEGAAQLQLGAEDCEYWDNGGAVTRNITETPEPSTLTLLVSALLGLAGAFYLRRRRAKE